MKKLDLPMAYMDSYYFMGVNYQTFFCCYFLIFVIAKIICLA